MDSVKDSVASAVRTALYYGGGRGKTGTPIISWRHELTVISPLETQLKVWPDENRSPRYFIIQIREQV